MLTIQNNVNLRSYNTFGIDCHAKHFTEVTSKEDIIELIQHPVFKKGPHLILGGGSNILFTADYPGLVIRNAIMGIDETSLDDRFVLVKVGAGENWHALVIHCLNKNYGGIENLSLIPGSVGAAPMQNIGAYGVEIKEVIESVEGIDLANGNVVDFSHDDCLFGYRESVFKNDLRGKYFISSVTLRLSKKEHQLNTTYGSLKDVIDANKGALTIHTVSDAVINIRKSKLPDPSVVGNAGSFFKNPVIDKSKFEKLKKDYSTIPQYPVDNQFVKIPAAWLIEQAGFKGKQVGKAAMHDKQALVLVNRGGATGEELLALSREVQHAVEKKFSIQLEPEVNII